MDETIKKYKTILFHLLFNYLFYYRVKCGDYVQLISGRYTFN